MKRCAYCEEEIRPGEPSRSTNNGALAFHRNCLLRQVIGSVAHQKQICSCYIDGSSDADPEGMTPRQAADAAVEIWEGR